MVFRNYVQSSQPYNSSSWLSTVQTLGDNKTCSLELTALSLDAKNYSSIVAPCK